MNAVKAGVAEATGELAQGPSSPAESANGAASPEANGDDEKSAEQPNMLHDEPGQVETAEEAEEGGSVQDGAAQRLEAGPVLIFTLSDILEDSDSEALLSGVSRGPLLAAKGMSQTSAERYCSRQADNCDAEFADLWRILGLISRHGTIENGGEDLDGVAQAIASYLMEAQEELDDELGTSISKPAGQLRLTSPSEEAEQRHLALPQVARLLILGNRADACDVAMEHGLWDHALVLASQEGPDSFKRVVAAMSNATFQPGQAMHAVYQLFAGRSPAPPPAAPPLYEDLERWRETLAAALANNIR
jgi:hypothetical protein